ncbi:MAG: peptide chain release factor 2 [Erysipelotrichaceae bacterium]|nr:peptide chain release factor 2 [Erysipelotrichaceae bacterium]
MELYEIRQQYESIAEKLRKLGDSLDTAGKQKRIDEISEMMLADGFWSDQRKAQGLINEANGLKDLLSSYHRLTAELQETGENLAMLRENYDEEIHQLVESEFTDIKERYEKFEIMVLLSHPYDQYNAILELHPGAGGTESQDWAEMLYRMYTRYAAIKGYKCTVLDWLDGEEAGIKSVTFKVEGPLAYGYLKGEKGIHRLVRISPFDASGRRHTSFVSLDVMPELSDNIEVEIRPEDIIVETHRSSGAGGQHINKTDSAVRIIHKPTGFVASCQSERSQLQNKEQAMNMLKAKLYQKYIEEQEAKIAAIKGEQKSIEWGSQIRSYVFCPYTLVKDHRTNYEEGNVDKVMNGEIDNFIYAYLKSQIK